jgi:hypothetical protein
MNILSINTDSDDFNCYDIFPNVFFLSRIIVADMLILFQTDFTCLASL